MSSYSSRLVQKTKKKGLSIEARFFWSSRILLHTKVELGASRVNPIAVQVAFRFLPAASVARFL